MLVIMTAHSQVNKAEDPEHLTFDQHDLKLHKKGCRLCREFADVIGYASLKRLSKQQKAKGFNDDRNRATSTGERILNLSVNPCLCCSKKTAMTWPRQCLCCGQSLPSICQVKNGPTHPKVVIAYQKQTEKPK